MDETFYTWGKLNKRTKLSVACHLALGTCARNINERSSFVGVFLQLLDSKREAHVLNVDLKNFGFDFVALLVEILRMLHALGPGDVRNVNQAINTFFNSNKNTEISDVADLTADDVANLIFLENEFPRVRLGLFHAE